MNRRIHSIKKWIIKGFKHSPIACSIVAIHFAAVLAMCLFSPNTREFFPVFKWSLFSWVANENRYYSVIIEELNGKTFEPDQNLFDHGERKKYFDDHPFIRAVAKGLESAPHSSTSRSMVQELENRYFSGYSSYSYRLVRHSAQPVEYFSSGSFNSSKVVYQKNSAGQ